MSWKEAFTPEQLEIRRQRAKEWNRNNSERVKDRAAAYAISHPDRVADTAKRARLKKKAQDPGYQRRVIERFYAGRPWLKNFNGNYPLTTLCDSPEQSLHQRLNIVPVRVAEAELVQVGL